jgi:hypothetical protein
LLVAVPARHPLFYRLFPRCYFFAAAGKMRLNDVAPGAQSASFLEDWPDFTFDELRRELKKRLKAEIPVAERDEWERYFGACKAEVEKLSARIADAEAEINDRVYRLFDLDREEIAPIENEITGQY